MSCGACVGPAAGRVLTHAGLPDPSSMIAKFPPRNELAV
jgi:hypothetical protein